MFRRADHYGDHLNSFDGLKLLALATMIVDHVGYFLYPESEWFRAVGRMAFPLFLFLVGYSGSWKRQSELVLWGSAITLTAALTHHALFPLDILIAIAIVRWMLPWILKRWSVLTGSRLARIFLGCVFWYPLFYWFEYSTVALLFAVCGYQRRHEPEALKTIALLYFTMLLHLFFETVVFSNFTLPQWLLMLAVLVCDTALMRCFRVKTMREFFPAAFRRVLQWCARNTLPIYGIHVMVLMIVQRIFLPQYTPVFVWFSF